MIKIEGETDTFIVTCRPSVMSRLLGINFSPSSTLSIELSYNIFYPLWSRLKNYQTPEQRISCFTEYLNEKFPKIYIPDEIDFIYDSIIENCINTPLHEILKDTKLSISSIQRNFIRRVGISPKSLARIVRINFLWDKIKNENAIDFQELIFYGNYFDQAHFIKDFKLATGEAPSHFFKRNLEICSAFSGKV